MLGDLTDAAGHQQLLKSINRMSLVRHLCANPDLSRVDLAAAVGLTKSTVSMLVRELISEGWLAEGEVVATGDRGRRPTPLVVNANRLVLVGADVGIGTLRVVSTTLLGQVLHTVEAEFDPDGSAADCIAVLCTALLKLTRKINPATRQVIGIGTGLPGGVDEATGVLRFAPNLGWRDVGFGELMAARLQGTALEGVPLFLQNEADVAAIGELEFNRDADSDPLLFLSVNHGVGAGVIVGDRLLSGHRGFAGEVGHMVLQLDGPRCSCGRLGCAETLVGLRAMTPGRGKADTAPGAHHRVVPLADIRARQQARDRGTLQAIDGAGRHLGVLLQNLWAAYDPASIVLGGSAIALGDEFVQPALDCLNGYAEAAGMAPPKVRLSRFGADAVAVGAAGLARYRLTRPLIAPAALARSRQLQTQDEED